MRRKDLPRFVIYQPNKKEFHLCFESGGEYLRWCSYYPPTMDVRFSREVQQIDSIPIKKLPKKPVYDAGTYVVSRTDDRQSAEDKFKDGIGKKIVAFILDGKKLKGRFALKKYGSGKVLQKYKDKYAAEEDITLNDLSRSIRNMVPNYDERKVKLTQTRKTRKAQRQEAKPVIEKPTADKKIDHVDYHFAFYSSKKEPDICLITDQSGAAVVLKHENSKCILLKSITHISSKKKKDILEHAEILSNQK